MISVYDSVCSVNRLTAEEVNRHPFIRLMDEAERDPTVLVDEAMLAKLELFARMHGHESIVCMATNR